MFNKRIMIALFLFFVVQTLAAKERIISAGGAVTELIYALQRGDLLVAVDVTSKGPQTEHLPKVSYHRQLSTEGLIALNPTRLIGSNEMGPNSTLSLLKQMGIKVDIVNSEPTVQGLLKRIDQLAKITQSVEKGGQIKREIEERVIALKQNQPVAGDKKRVLFLLLSEGRAPTVAGKETVPDRIIQLAGGINPAAETLSSYKPLAQEALLALQPDLILVSQRSFKSFAGIDAILQEFPMLQVTPAGKNRAIHAIDGAAIVGGLGLKSLAASKDLNAVLYPKS